MKGIVIASLLSCIAAVSAFAGETLSLPQDTVYVDTNTVVIFRDPETGQIRELVAVPLPIAQPERRVSATPEPKEKLPVHFAWGADLGASIDLSGNDMSSIDFGLAFGMRRGWINFLGVGAQANLPISNSCRSFPLFLLFRTNFRDRPSRVFWELRGGASLNYLEHNHRQTGIYGYTGIGFNLAGNSKFSTFMSLGYTYMQRRRIVGAEMTHDFTDLHYATVKIGVTF